MPNYACKIVRLSHEAWFKTITLDSAICDLFKKCAIPGLLEIYFRSFFKQQSPILQQLNVKK